MKRLMMALLCAFVVKAAVAEAVYVTAANFESYRTLQNGNTYRFAEDIDYTAWETESAMKVASGANVVIEIAAGVTVNLTGGAANGWIGAGAGIEVQEGAKLIIGGAGMLYVNGGKAADGANGGQGEVGLTGGFDESDSSGGGAGGFGFHGACPHRFRRH